MREDYKYFTAENENEPFIIDLCGISYCDGTYRIERKNSNIFVFEYIIKGTGVLESDHVTYTPKAGDVYILHKGSNHTYFSDAKNPWEKIWFNVRGPLVEKLVEAYGIDAVVYLEQCEIYELFKRFYQTVSQDEPSSAIHQKCALIFHEIVAAIAERVHTEQRQYSREVTKIRQYIEQHLCERVTLRALSQIVFLSQSQTIRIFKQEMNKTPYAYLLEKRMELAESLLKGTNLPIKEIAYDLGFADQHYFSNLFKLRTGKSPRLFRTQA